MKVARLSLIVLFVLLLGAACAAPVTSPIDAPNITPDEPEAGPSGAQGAASFRDKFATADQFVLEMTGVAAPPAGQAYQGWLLSDDGTVATSVGMLALNADKVRLEWSSPTGENLLVRYSRFQVTLEPPAGSATPSGAAVLAGALAGEALTKARQVFVRSDAKPAPGGHEDHGTPTLDEKEYDDKSATAGAPNTALAPGLKSQTDLAVQHVQNAINAAAIGSSAEMRVHLEHVINILEGASGPRFGDHDGDGKAQNPGDGFGVLNYAQQLGDLNSDQRPVKSAVQVLISQLAPIEDKCLEIIRLQDAAAAAFQLKDLKTLADQLKAGPVAQLYQAAQEMTTFKVTPTE